MNNKIYFIGKLDDYIQQKDRDIIDLLIKERIESYSHEERFEKDIDALTEGMQKELKYEAKQELEKLYPIENALPLIDSAIASLNVLYARLSSGEVVRELEIEIGKKDVLKQKIYLSISRIDDSIDYFISENPIVKCMGDYIKRNRVCNNDDYIDLREKRSGIIRQSIRTIAMRGKFRNYYIFLECNSLFLK